MKKYVLASQFDARKKIQKSQSTFYYHTSSKIAFCWSAERGKNAETSKFF